MEAWKSAFEKYKDNLYSVSNNIMLHVIILITVFILIILLMDLTRDRNTVIIL